MASTGARSGLLACLDQAPLRLLKRSTKRRIAKPTLPECLRNVILRANPSHILRPRRAALAHVEVDRPADHRTDRRGDVVEDHRRDGRPDRERDEAVAPAGVPGTLPP